MFKYLIGTILWLITLSLGSSGAEASLVKFDFTGSVFSTFGVPNAGTSVSGYLTFDPAVPLAFTCGAGCGGYFQSSPATFYFATNGGFVLQQSLTEINIADKFANGITDYYVFDADVGTFSSTTDFSRLELTLSDNVNPQISDINIPTSPPDFSGFEFHTVAFFGFDGFTPSQRVDATITSLTLDVPEPNSLLLLCLGLLLTMATGARRAKRAAR